MAHAHLHTGNGLGKGLDSGLDKGLDDGLDNGLDNSDSSDRLTRCNGMQAGGIARANIGRGCAT